tara:strand:+ start:48 stop:1121 length:1074 start_codon:yes stop_codon:yes gene_type:complete
VIIYLYLFKRFSLGLIVSLIILVSLEIFFSFTAEIKYLNVGNYNIFTLSEYVILNIPKSISIMFPYAVLIGSMLSLGAMASDMEFVSMQAAGISVTKIMTIVIIQAFILSAIFYYISDSIVPSFSNKAEKNKNLALNKKVIFHQNGVWFKDNNTYIKINEIYSNENLRDITMYKYDEKNILSSIKTIVEARYIDKIWKLTKTEETILTSIPITKKYFAEEETMDFIDRKLINIKTHKASSLSLSDVVKNISYLEKNNLDATIQKKIYWNKILKPFSTVIMLFLSMPFIFGRQRSSNLSQRIILGVFIGIAFFIISSILPNLGMVFGIAPLISVLLPNLLFIIAGKYLLDYQLEASLR